MGGLLGYSSVNSTMSLNVPEDKNEMQKQDVKATKQRRNLKKKKKGSIGKATLNKTLFKIHTHENGVDMSLRPFSDDVGHLFKKVI